ncbi:MAG: hypothetical protein RR617_01895 [Anaerovoracaceae bacterium]
MKKILITVVLIASLVISVPTLAMAGDNVNQTTKNATTYDKNMVKVVKNMCEYTSVFCSEATAKPYTKSKMKDADKYSVAMVVGFAKSGKTKYTSKELMDATYQIFGKKGDIKNASKAKYVKKKGKNYYYNGGEWGLAKPSYKIESVKKTSSGEYIVVATNTIKSFDPEDSGKIVDIGKTEIKLKKSSKSKDGYIVKGFGYQVYAWEW